MQPVAVVPLNLGVVKAFVIKGERSILVDAGNAGDARKIIQGLTRLKINPQDLSLIIITHSHSDHIGGLAKLKEVTGARVLVHQLDAEALVAGINKDIIPTNFKGDLFKRFIEERPKIKTVEPDILIDGEHDLQKYGVAGKVIGTPGHTAGSISIVLENGEAIIGDLLMGGLILQRFPSYPYFAYNLDLVKESIKKLQKLDLKKLYPSHGGPFAFHAVKKRFADC
ncbi:MAG TPA: MBL fold metallo-hydrolase [Bacillota bacterium]|nr:MBL fold metallo-hydrolase [Bacillota bacterium]HOL08938.1 MBL fold metallo-hydrolase [Bacillota bacterium]HPO96508.1 MBL fold metallo-hydrolase [Bacillota bacterium]